MIKYHFFGKETGLESPLKRQEDLLLYMQKCSFASKYNDRDKISKLLLMNQVHGKDVVVIDSISKIYDENSRPNADGIVCNLPEIVIGVITADCAPVLLFDEKAKIIGAAHAGWRGAKAGILSEVVMAMKKLGAREISAVLGPMIHQTSYEVSADFVAEFLAEDCNNSQFFLPLQKSAFGSEDLNQKSLFDLPAYVQKKLNLLYIFSIKNLGIDTYTNSQEFFSYRLSCHLGQKSYGQNVAAITFF